MPETLTRNLINKKWKNKTTNKKSPLSPLD